MDYDNRIARFRILVLIADQTRDYVTRQLLYIAAIETLLYG